MSGKLSCSSTYGTGSRSSGKGLSGAGDPAASRRTGERSEGGYVVFGLFDGSCRVLNRIYGLVRLVYFELDGGFRSFHGLPRFVHGILETSEIPPRTRIEIELDILGSAGLCFAENDVELLDSEYVPEFVGLFGHEEYGEYVTGRDEYETPENAGDHIS